jgi:N utilization substance protein A
VAVLLDHGLTEDITEALITGGVATVEKLGAMTPEQLEAVPGIDPDMVERIQQAVMNYYGQFEGSVEGQAAAEAALEIDAAEAAGETDAPAVEIDAASAPADAIEEPVTAGASVEEPQKQSVTIDSGEPSASD